MADLVPDYALPAMVEAVFLPYRGKYVYDGFLVGTNLYFGSSIRGNMNETFKSLKARRGIIESAADHEQTAADGYAEAEREMRHILNSHRRWEEEEDRLDELLDHYPKLADVFDSAVSRLGARAIKNRLKNLPVTGRHFAVFHDSVVAVAPSRGELDQQLQALSFIGQAAHCAIFKV